MTTLTVTLQRPLDWQHDVIDTRARFNVLACGRRSGKSTLGQHQLIHTALQGKPTGWFSPTYKLLSEQWRELRSTLEPITRTKSEQDHRLELVTGGVLEMWSLDDPNPARGRKYARVVVDEAGMVPNLMDIWQLAIRPTLTDFQGDAWFLSTPRGLNDFHLLYQLGQDPTQTIWRSWQMPTAVNPYISASEIEAARAELPERAFAQEFLAQFLVLDGASVFRGVHAVARLQPRAPEQHHQYIFGVDWGRTNDFTVISVIDASTQEQVFMDRFSQIEYEFQTERLHRIAAAYKPRTIVAESNAMGTPIIERLQRGYVLLDGTKRPPLPIWSFTTTNATKAAAVIDLSVAIEDGALTLLDDAVQTGELLAYESTVLPSGLLRYAAPQGAHDDTVSALALAYAGAKASPEVSRSRYAFGR